MSGLFSNYQLVAAEKHMLFTVMVELTYRCNLDCVFCYNDTGQHGKPLRTSQYLDLLEELRAMGVLNIILTGGEPLAHPDFFEIGRKARELGFVIRIKSNGHALRNKLAKRVRNEVDPFVIDVSLHGASQATHDRQTRVPGSFKRLMENLPKLLDMGLRLKLNATITRWNADEIEQMFHIADSLGIPLAVSNVISPKDDGDQSPFAIEASHEQKASVFRYLGSRDEKVRNNGTPDSNPANSKIADAPPVSRTVNCGAGTSTMTIDPVGNVIPCVQWRRPVGSLHESSIREIWGAQNADIEEIRKLNRQAKQLADEQGSKMRYLSHCPGLADMNNGDPVSLYPSIIAQMKIIDEVEPLQHNP